VRSGVYRALFLVAGMLSTAASAADVTAGAPIERSVTIYRPPALNSQPLPSPDSLDLDFLRGFALISETRRVDLPAGESRIRFEGVANDIEPDTALISGLPVNIVEKNQDARVLSPAELIATAIGRTVVLVRTHPKTGQVTRTSGIIRSDADFGVVFESAEGVEGLRCSGLPETFRFDPTTDLGASPTLSVLVESPTATSVTVALSYLAAGFDWTADYVAMLSEDGRSIDLGAWVTLANSNDVSFPGAHTQVVAGRLNRVSDDQLAAQPYGTQRIVATCWAHGTTSDMRDEAESAARIFMRRVSAPEEGDLQEVVATAQKRAVQEEQLGDLKLYRVPETTDVRSHQMKQVRLLDRSQVPVETYYRADLRSNGLYEFIPAERRLRTRNDSQHHLGLALPAGGIDTFAQLDAASLLIGHSKLRDSALNEEVEFAIGDSNEVRIHSVTESTTLTPSRFQRAPPRLRGVRRFKSATVEKVQRVEIFNARAIPVPFELHLLLSEGEQLIRADHAPTGPSTQPLFKLSIPADGSVTIRYQTVYASGSGREDP
jgi:hypothetical protein